jgi:putative intracellular protease/amidase
MIRFVSTPRSCIPLTNSARGGQVNHGVRAGHGKRPSAASCKHIMPWRIEDEMKKLGANYVQSGAWRGFAVRDGNLITGQQNFSGSETAELLLQTLGR